MAWNPEREVEILASAYRSGTLEILKRIERLTAAERSSHHARAALTEVTQILRELDEFADEWIEQNIPVAYRTGWEEALDTTVYAGRQAVGARVSYADFARIHREAVEVLAYSLRDNLRSATQKVGRQATDIYRRVGLEATQRRLLTGETISETTSVTKERFLKQGVVAFEDRTGRVWSLDSYCRMVARTTTREAVSVGTMNRAAAGGYDLLIVSEHHPTCEKCAPLAGKVFSISGDTSGYPKWEGYVPVHPNCRHVISVYQPKFDSDAERRKEHSNTSLTQDPRSETEKRAYKAAQDDNRRKRDLRDQYRRYRARLGEKAGTIQNFARAKKADGHKWTDLQAEYRKQGASAKVQIERFQGDFIILDGTGRIELERVPGSQLKTQEFVEDCVRLAELQGADFTGVNIVNIDGILRGRPNINGFVSASSPEDKIYLLATDIQGQAAQAKRGLAECYKALKQDVLLKKIDRLDDFRELTKRTLLHELSHIETKRVVGNYLDWTPEDWKQAGLDEYVTEVFWANGCVPVTSREIGEWIAEDLRLMYDPDSPYPHTYAVISDLINPLLAELRRRILRGVLR